MDNISLELFAKRAEIYRLLRYMMFENPLEAEEYAVDIPELMEADIAGIGALEFTTPHGTEYIVYSRGTKYTTTVRPTHIPGDRIRKVAPRATSQTLWPRLQESCQVLGQLSSDAYTKFGIGKILDSIAYFYSRQSTPHDRPGARYIKALVNLGEPSKLAGDDAINSWIHTCKSQLIELYASYLLAGDEVKQVFATLLFFELCPFSITSLFEMNQEYLSYTFSDIVAGKQITMAFPIADIRFYLEHPTVQPDLAVVWGTSAARVLQGKAEQLRDEAKLKYSVEQFHFRLYVSLLYYRCALYAYRTVLSLSKANLVIGERAVQRIEAARTEVALCEEHRVIIMASLTAALGIRQLAVPTIASVEEVQNWVGGLTRLSPSSAELEIRQAYDAELLMPKFLRDLALGLFACINGQTKTGLAKMLAVMEELEKHIQEAAFLGDPNYLSSTYGLMSLICAKNGMESESLEYSRRAEPAYYQKLLSPA